MADINQSTSDIPSDGNQSLPSGDISKTLQVLSDQVGFLAKQQEKFSKDNEHIQNDQKKLSNDLKILKDNYTKIRKEETLINQEQDKIITDQANQKNDHIRIIEVISLFAVLITFVTGDIQIFKIASSIKEVGGLTLILASVLILFVLLMEIVLRNLYGNQEENKHILNSVEIILFITLVTILAFGITGIFMVGNKVQHADNGNVIPIDINKVKGLLLPDNFTFPSVTPTIVLTPTPTINP